MEYPDAQSPFPSHNGHCHPIRGGMWVLHIRYSTSISPSSSPKPLSSENKCIFLKLVIEGRYETKRPTHNMLDFSPNNEWGQTAAGRASVLAEKQRCHTWEGLQDRSVRKWRSERNALVPNCGRPQVVPQSARPTWLYHQNTCIILLDEPTACTIHHIQVLAPEGSTRLRPVSSGL